MYHGSHVHRNRPQPQLSPGHSPPRRLARGQENREAHPGQPLRLAAAQDRCLTPRVARRAAGLSPGPVDHRSHLPHGHVEAILAMIHQLDLKAVISSKRCRERDLVVAMIVQRLIDPCSKLATTRAWHATTLAEELGVAEATEDELYAALDWLVARQER